MPYVVGSFAENSFGESLGLQVGDSIVGLNGQEMLFFDQYKTVLPDYAGEEVNLAYYRDGKADTLTFTLPESGRLDVYNTTAVFKYYEIKNKKYSFASALSGAGDEVAAKLDGYIRSLNSSSIRKPKHIRKWVVS